eukprot:609045-Pelagomonas_calceolata.AAC.1
MAVAVAFSSGRICRFRSCLSLFTTKASLLEFLSCGNPVQSQLALPNAEEVYRKEKGKKRKRKTT